MTVRTGVPVGPVALVALCVLLGALASARAGSPLIVVGVVSGLIACYPAFRLVTGRESDPFAPIQLFVLYLAVTVHVRAILIRMGNSGILTALYDTSGAEVAGLLTLALASTGVFLLCLYVGYYGGIAERVCAAVPRFEGPPPNDHRATVAVVISFCVAAPVAALLWSRIGAAVTAGTFTSETRAGGVFWMAYLVWVAVFGSLLPYFVALRDGTPWAIARRAAFALAIAVFAFILFPKKIVIANQLLLVLVGYHYLRKRISVGTLAVAGVGGFLLLPLLSQFRADGFAALESGRFWALAQVVWQHPLLLLQPVLLRTFGADSLILILDGFRMKQAFALGGTLQDVLWWFVPRGMWPDKPFSYAIVFGQEYLARSNYFSANVSGSPTVVGECLLNFGLPGLVVGGVLMGVLLRVPFVYLVRRRMSFGAVLLFGTFMTGPAMFVEGPIALHIVDLVVRIGIVLALLGVMEVASLASGVWRHRPAGRMLDARRD